jgi:phage-related tail protein
MDMAKEIYLNTIEEITYGFEEALTGGLNLKLLQEQYDKFIDDEERYLDAVNARYEITKYQNKLQKDIDSTTNATHKKELQDLYDEIETRAENNTLSEYDLKIMEAKYEMLQKQIALEEA